MDREIAQRIEGALEAVDRLGRQIDALRSICDTVMACLERGGIIYTCGNGGSAAEALHLAEELIGRYRGNRRPLRAVCLNADATALTCIANDFGYEEVFARQCAALVGGDDVLIVFSTSGNSPNIVKAAHTARGCGATVIGFLGRDGGACASACDHAVVVPVDDSAHIQEAHQVAMHIVCEMVERSVGADS